MITKKHVGVLSLIICMMIFSAESYAKTQPSSAAHPINTLLGERFDYDISFLWFDHLGEGSLRLENGPEAGTYLIVLQAKTLGVAAFFTRHRVEKYQTLMEIGPDGRLRPLWHAAHSIRGEGADRKEKIARYTFDYLAHKVRYQKQKNARTYADQWYDLTANKPVYDILTALYNLRLGYFGPPGQGQIVIPTFHHKGLQEIVIEPLDLSGIDDGPFFGTDSRLCRILVDPSVFGTSGRDILASFDEKMRPDKGIIKNVIGLGDVKGRMRTY